MIVTYGTIKAKQAVKDSSRILGYPFAMGDRITKAMPAAVMGKDVPLKEIFDPEHKRYGEGGEFRVALRRRPRRQEGRRHRDRHRGPQAAVGRARRRRDHVQRAAARRHPAAQARPPTARSSPSSTTRPARRLGLIKMDFLGLRNLTVLDDALSNIEANRGETVVLEELDARRRRRPTSCCQRGDTLGVFQLDGGPMRALLRCMRPDTFEDISAVGALYRPGPMGADSHNKYARRKNGREADRRRSTPSSPSRSRRSWARPTA